MAEIQISEALERDVPELLPLMRGYCDFYGTNPPDSGLEEMAIALIGGEGVVFTARGAGESRLSGFATSAVKWSMLRGARVALLDDLFVEAGARGRGIGERLIDACSEWARARGAVALEWQTALDNETAQGLYDRIGAKPSKWLDYELELADVPGRAIWKGKG